MKIEKQLIKEIRQGTVTTQTATLNPNTIGQFGKLWMRWMVEYHPKAVWTMQLNNTFSATAEQINMEAMRRVLTEAEVLLKHKEMPNDPVERAQMINGCRATAEESIKEMVQQITPFK